MRFIPVHHNGIVLVMLLQRSCLSCSSSLGSDGAFLILETTASFGQYWRENGEISWTEDLSLWCAGSTLMFAVETALVAFLLSAKDIDRILFGICHVG